MARKKRHFFNIISVDISWTSFTVKVSQPSGPAHTLSAQCSSEHTGPARISNPGGEISDREE